MPELISITACAKVLNSQGSVITSQGLGKYCKAHELIRGRGEGRGKPALVDLEEVIAHRKENFTREVMTGEASGTKQKPTLALAANNPAPANDEEPARLGDAQRLKRVQADKAELELEREIGNLTSTDAVDAGIAEAISAQRSAAMATLSTWAERLSAELGLPSENVRQIRAAGKTLLNEAQQAFCDEAAKIATKTRREEISTRARQWHLAAIAHRLRLSGRDPSTNLETTKQV